MHEVKLDCRDYSTRDYTGPGVYTIQCPIELYGGRQMKPSFYLAGKYSDREKLHAYASALRANGFYVNAEWLEGNHEARDAKSQAKYANADFADIRNSTRFLVVQNSEQSAGRNIELGYALALGRHTVTVGSVTSVFHHLVTQQFATFEEFLEDLKSQFS